MDHAVGEIRPRKDEAPRADRGERCFETRIGAGGDRHRLEEGVLREDPRDALGVRRDEAPAGRSLRDRHESRPALASAPQRRHAPVEHHRRPVARPVEVHGLEVALLVEAQAVQHVAREQHEPRAAGAEGDRSALEILDRPRRRVRAHHEHAGRGVHRGDDADGRRCAAHALQRLVGDLALHERQVHLVLLEQRHVLGAALRVARLDRERRIDLAHGGDDGVAVDGKAAAGRGGGEGQREGHGRGVHCASRRAESSSFSSRAHCTLSRSWPAISGVIS